MSSSVHFSKLSGENLVNEADLQFLARDHMMRSFNVSSNLIRVSCCDEVPRLGFGASGRQDLAEF